MYKRSQYKTLFERVHEERNLIQVIAGPRQVGKSTLVKQLLKECEIPHLLVSADNVPATNTDWISESWETARMRLDMGGGDEFLLVIDEIHKINNWSEAVKKEWDYDTMHDVNIKAVILGSSRLLLKNGLTESLAGRFEMIHMPHWSFAEMHEAFGFSFKEYVYFGGYPGGAKLIGDESRWRKYIKESIVAPAIERDVVMTKRIFKPVLMKQLFELGCVYSGEELSLNKMVGQLQDAGNVTTLANYLLVLDESCLLCGLHKYANDNARKYNSIPKLLVYNTALLSALSGVDYSRVISDAKVWGRWVESAVGMHLLNQANECGYEVNYWRERDDEVDFVIVYNRKTIAIEVKSGRRTTNRGLSLFREKFNPARAFVVGSGGVPVEEFITWDMNKLLNSLA
ncbi:MAG: ATP-binding protein [Bacteroidales bacterium]|nr:ATP-binding protein [Bacteroidales bacterium]